MNNKSVSRCTEQNKRQKILMEHSCPIRAVNQLGGLQGKKLLNMFLQYSKSAV